MVRSRERKMRINRRRDKERREMDDSRCACK